MASPYKKANPFPRAKPIIHGVLFKPDTFKVSLMLLVLNPISLRVLLYALANLQIDGSVALSQAKMAAVFQTDSSYIGKGIRELLQYKFMARRSRSSFWLNPDVARPIGLPSQQLEGV